MASSESGGRPPAGIRTPSAAVPRKLLNQQTRFPTPGNDHRTAITTVHQPHEGVHPQSATNLHRIDVAPVAVLNQQRCDVCGKTDQTPFPVARITLGAGARGCEGVVEVGNQHRVWIVAVKLGTLEYPVFQRFFNSAGVTRAPPRGISPVSIVSIKRLPTASPAKTTTRLPAVLS